MLALFLAAGTDAVIAAAYAYTGWLLAERQYSPDVRRAGRLFAAWWFGIAATAVLSGTLSILASEGAAPWLIDALDQATLVAFAAALVGFTSYVAFLLRGDHRALVPILCAYAALAAWSVGSALAHPAVGYHVEAWRPIVDRPPSFGPPPALSAALLVAPVVAGTAAYASLALRTVEREARYRILLVTGALATWLLGVTVVSLPQLGGSVAAQAGGRVAIVLSAALILLAYRPPGIVRAWLGEHAAVLEHRARWARMAERVRDLV